MQRLASLSAASNDFRQLSSTLYQFLEQGEESFSVSPHRDFHSGCILSFSGTFHSSSRENEFPNGGIECIRVKSERPRCERGNPKLPPPRVSPPFPTFDWAVGARAVWKKASVDPKCSPDAPLLRPKKVLSCLNCRSSCDRSIRSPPPMPSPRGVLQSLLQAILALLSSYALWQMLRSRQHSTTSSAARAKSTPRKKM